MSARRYSLLAALIFALIALVQLTRAALGWPVTVGTLAMPLWPSWIAFIVAAILAGLGFRAWRG